MSAAVTPIPHTPSLRAQGEIYLYLFLVIFCAASTEIM
jgi:peptidoglycan/LPS O-acetylase OafA/YrhL